MKYRARGQGVVQMHEAEGEVARKEGKLEPREGLGKLPPFVHFDRIAYTNVQISTEWIGKKKERKGGEAMKQAVNGSKCQIV